MWCWSTILSNASRVLRALVALYKESDMDEDESVERLWDLAEETFENSKDNLNRALEVDYQFSLDDLDKILPELAKRIFMMGFITGLETQIFDDEEDDNEEGIN